MEECRKRKLNQKARNLSQPNPEYPDYHPEYPDTPNPDYPDSIPEYPGIHVTFTLFPPTKCKNPFKSMNGMMHNV